MWLRTCDSMTKRKPVKPRDRDSYGDPNYKGRGALLCYLCDTPIKAHVIFGPCPAPMTKTPRRPEKMGRAGGQTKK